MVPISMNCLRSLCSAHFSRTNCTNSVRNSRCFKCHVKIHEEDWGDDVSIIDRYEGASPSTIIFKIVLALIMIGACSGALVYSIINSEDEQKHEFEPSEKFPIRANQECTNGSLTMTYRTGQDMGDASGYSTVNCGCTWIQDDDKKRLYHRVGLGQKDFQYAYYVFENITFFQMRKGKCYQMPQGYNEFLDSQGLDYITLQKDEDFMIGNQYTNVLIYEGEPPLDTNINGEHPSLIRGYASTSSLLTYGWQMYFAHTTNFSLYKQEYWFPTMKNKAADFGIFDDIPEECLKL